MNHPTQHYILLNNYDDMIYTLLLNPGWGYSQEFFGGVMPPGSLNPYPVSELKKCHFLHSFSDLISKIHTHFQTWPNLACSRLSDKEETTQFPPVLFSRFLNSADPTISKPGTG